MENPIGVIVARFQVPELHAGHCSLIERVLQRHQQVAVVLGESRSQLSPKNPLDYETRVLMLKEAYPQLQIIKLVDCRSDSLWSRRLDKLIEQTLRAREAILYGSRQSFLNCYSGKFPVRSLLPVAAVSGTESRQAVQVAASSDFRKGVIYACQHRYPIAYPTVDVAIVDYERKRVLLGMRQEDSGKLRFIGGFVAPTDESIEQAARREVSEEATFLEVDSYRYLGSVRINDWRYPGDPDAIITSFFAAHYVFGAPRPGDDIEDLRWIAFDRISEVIVSEHQPLAEMLKKHLAQLEKELSHVN